jgi:hypothetical protein
MTNYSPNKCLRTFKKVNSIEKSIALKLPSLTSYKKIIGEDKLEVVIKLWLVDLNNCLNLRRPMSEENIDLIAIYILSDYGNLTMSDINLVFTRAKTGYYGELYESLNTAKVLLWFSEYSESRMTVAGELSILKHNQEKGKGDASRISEKKEGNTLSINDMMGFISDKNPTKK